MANTYSLEELRILLKSGGKLHQVNGQLFAVAQTGLIIGPIYVEPGSFLVQRNSTQEISMSGENYNNPLIIEADGAISVTDINVVDRDTVTFKVTPAFDAVRSGHKLTYKTRPNGDGSSYDGSEVQIQNNVVVVPQAPYLAMNTAVDSASMGDYATGGFLQTGLGEAASLFPSGRTLTAFGANFFDMQDIQDELAGSDTLASIGIVGAGDPAKPEDDNLRLRIGSWDAVNSIWTDHSKVSIVRQADISGSEASFTCTISIDDDLDLDDFTDVLTLDCLVETRSGGLAPAQDGDGLASVALAEEQGAYSLQQGIISIRRARLDAIVSITEVADGSIDVAQVQGGDDSSLVSALAAGTAVAGDHVTNADIAFSQNQRKVFVIECESPFAALLSCVDSSVTVERAASTSTSPPMGRLNTAQNGDPHYGWSTVGSGDNQLSWLSETQFMMTLDARSDQPIGTYEFAARTLSNHGLANAAIFKIDVAQAELIFTGFDVVAFDVDAIKMAGPDEQIVISGSGFPDGFNLSGHPNEAGAVEGSMEIMYVRSADQHNGSYFELEQVQLNTAGALGGADVEVLNDTTANAIIGAPAANATQWLQAGGEIEQTLGLYDAQIRATDANGQAQTKTLLNTLRVMHSWPAQVTQLSVGSNAVRENSLGGAFATEDDLEFEAIKLRGQSDIASQVLLNGVSDHDEYLEHEFELMFPNGSNSGDPALDLTKVSTYDALELLQSSDPAGSAKPFLLIKRVEAAPKLDEFGNFVYQQDADGLDQKVYAYRMVLECVSEEALVQGALTPNGLADVVLSYGGQSMTLRIRTKDYDVGDPMTEWMYIPDALQIVPDNVEMDALSATNAATEVQRTATADVSMAGDNLYPLGAGTYQSDGNYSTGIPGADESGGENHEGSGNEGGAGVTIDPAFFDELGNPDGDMDFQIDLQENVESGLYQVTLTFADATKASDFETRRSAGMPLYIWDDTAPAANIDDMIQISMYARVESAGTAEQWVAQGVTLPGGWDMTIVSGRAYEQVDAHNNEGGPTPDLGSVEVNLDAVAGTVTFLIDASASGMIMDNMAAGIEVRPEGEQGTYSVFVDSGDLSVSPEGLLVASNQSGNFATWDLIVEDPAFDRVDIYVQ